MRARPTRSRRAWRSRRSCTYDAWRELAEAALKGAPFEKKLVTPVADGFNINPLYTLADFDDASAGIHEAMVASSVAQSTKIVDKAGWDIRQLHAYPDPKLSNSAILEDLENGATSIQIVFDQSACSGQGPGCENAGETGVMLYSLADVEVALEGVFTDLAPVSLQAGQGSIAAGALIAARSEKDQGDALIEFNYDPIGTLAATGSLPNDLA